MGVELRVHTFFLLLAVVCLGLGASDGILRGLGVFFVLVVAIVVREIVRLLVAAWLGPTKLARAILFATITNIVAYLPFLLMRGDVGRFVYSEETNRAVAVDSTVIIEALRKLYDAGSIADELQGR